MKFIEAIPQTKEPIQLSVYDTFESKINAIYSYASINNIYVEVRNPEAIENLDPTELKVKQINVPLGTASYTLTVLKKCQLKLAEEAKKYVRSQTDYETISD